MNLVDLMDGYFRQDIQVSSVMSEAASRNFETWQKVESPERLIKDYIFPGRAETLEFLRQLFLFEDEMNHHAKIIVDFDRVRIEVYTHDIDAITELDADYAKVADQIFMDVA